MTQGLLWFFPETILLDQQLPAKLLPAQAGVVFDQLWSAYQ
jgi:hypothetical protein